MNAALSKGQEMVEFIWDNPGGLVRIQSFDYSKGTDAYKGIATETSKYAREYWEGLVESGFRRIYTKVPTSESL
jgi:hypothetical protein